MKLIELNLEKINKLYFKYMVNRPVLCIIALFCFVGMYGETNDLYTFNYSDPLAGKSIGVFGDSYVRNHREPYEKTWHYKFAKKHGMDYYNYGRNGSAVAIDRERFGPAMYKRLGEMRDSLDYIIVIAGHNDASLLDTIGIDNYKEKLGVLCEGLIEKYPKAHILFFTRWTCKDFEGSASQEVVDATIDVCGRHSIPVFDAARRGNIYAQSDSFREIYFQNEGHGDTAHLNEAGHDRFLPVAENFILQYVEAPEDGKIKD